jgi:hypothetical protein
MSTGGTLDFFGDQQRLTRANGLWIDVMLLAQVDYCQASGLQLSNNGFSLVKRSVSHDFLGLEILGIA